MIIKTLKQQLSEEEFQVVIRSLRQDPIIWSALQDEQLLHRIKSQKFKGLDQWAPANIALTHIKLEGKTDLLSGSPGGLDEATKTKAAEVFESLLSPINPPNNQDQLSLAAYASLALRERWLLLDTIEEALFDLISENAPLWKTVLSILYGLLPNRNKVLAFLLNSPKETRHALALHLVSSQPLTVDRQSKLMLSSLSGINPLQRSVIMRTIRDHDPALAQQLASDLLETLPSADERSADPVQSLIDLMERTELLKTQGQFQQVLPALEQIRKMTTSLQADLTAQLAQAAARGNDQQTAMEAIQKISELETSLQIEENQNIALAHINTGVLEASHLEAGDAEEAGKSSGNISLLLSAAKAALKHNQPEKAQNNAQQAYQQTLAALKHSGRSSHPAAVSLTPEFLQTMVELLISVQLPEEAAAIGQYGQERYPNNAGVIHAYALALKQFSKYDQAVDYNHIAMALSPTPEAHRALIDTLIKKGDWTEARKESEKLVSTAGSATPEDFRYLAECYLQTDQPTDAINACQKGLAIDPENWLLLRMLGKIHQQQGAYPAAQKYLSQAIVHHPEEIEAWLELANLHRLEQDLDKALEKLVSAANVNPHDPELQLHLGLLHLERGDPVKALTAFNQAARYVQPETRLNVRREISLQLGKTLFDGGYLEEAVAVFEKAHNDHPADGQIAYLYALALIQTQSFEKAFPVLNVVMQSADHPLEANLDYAETLLQMGKSPEVALDHIQIVLDQQPKHERGRILLAKATAASDDHTAALELYQEALQTELSKQPGYFVALTIGIANSAFKTEQPHLAITFLKEGLRQIPDSLPLKRSLCQAFIHANLKPDALAVLQEVRESSESSLENLLWTADQAIALRELDLAGRILHEALQLAPQNTEIIVRLGYVQLENGQDDIARQIFGQLFEVEAVDISDMKLAAHALIGMGDLDTSIPFIEKALEMCDYQSGDLLSELTRLYIQAEQLPAALDAVHKHLHLSPNDHNLWITQSEILTQLGRPKAALHAIEEALKLAPASASLHSRAAEIYRQEDDLSVSLEHVKTAHQLDPDNISIRLQAAEVFRAGLMDQAALNILLEVEEQPNGNLWLLNKAELLLDNPTLENVSIASQAVSQVLKTTPDYPRGLAVKARILASQAQEIEAREVFTHSYEQYTAFSYDDLDRFSQVSILLSIGEAALALKDWEKAFKLGELAQDLTPAEPRPHIFLAKAYSLRAEFQLACTAVKAHKNAPGAVAVNEASQAKFAAAIEALYELTPDAEQAPVILRWEQRGQYALMNREPFQKPVMAAPDDFAALVAAARRSETRFDLQDISEEWLNTDPVKFQLSLSYSISDPHNACQIAEDLAYTHPHNPIYLAHYAMLSYRIHELPAALNHIQQALDLWPDESHWHVFAASLETEKNNHTQAIDHLEAACCLEEDTPMYLYQLGNAYLNGALPGNAIRVLESAVNLQPLEPEYWATLSLAYRAAGELDQATTSIEKSAKLAPQSVKYRLQAARIAQDKGSAIRSDQFLQQAIELKPRDPEDVIELTNLLLKQHKAEQAIKILDELIELSLSPVLLQLQKAAIIRETKGVREETKLLVQLIKQEPRNPLILARLCSAYLQINQPQDAIKAGQFAIKHGEKELSIGQLSKLNYQVGTLFLRSGQLDQALSYLAKSIKLTPHFIDAYIEISKTLQARRESSKALSYLEDAMLIAPHDPRPYLHAGVLLKEGKDYLGAESMLKKASALDPEDVNIKRQLAAVIAMAIIHQNESR